MAVTILVADDQADIRRLLSMMLARSDGWNVVQADDGAQALQLCHEQDIAMVILDHRMPRLSGTEVARTLRQEAFSGPILLFSAYLDPEVEDEASELGLLTLPKSEISEVVTLVQDALGS